MASMKKSRQTKQVRKANIAADAPSAWQQTHDAFQSLKEQLTAAYEDAKARAAQDSVADALDEVDAMLRILNQEDMASRTVDLSAAADETEEAVKKLEALKQELEGIASRVATVAKVIQGIDDAIAVAKACFGIA